MKRFLFTTIVTACIISLLGCNSKRNSNASGDGGTSGGAASKNQSEFNIEEMRSRLIEGAEKLPRSNALYFEDGLVITGLGVTFGDRPTEFNGVYLFPAIEKMTGVHLDFDWYDSEGYGTIIASTLLSGTKNLPDLINPVNFGIMDLAQDDIIIPLDDYLYLMPDIVNAVGLDRMDLWRVTDGHIYTIPDVTQIQGSFSMMVREDWLQKLGLKTPTTWDEWVAYWRAVSNTDLNGNGDTTDEVPFAFVAGMNGERRFSPLLNAFGIVTTNDTQFCVLEDGTYTMIYEHPRYREYLSAVADLYKEGIIPDDFDSYSYDSIETMMGENCLASTFTFAASGAKTEQLRQTVPEAKWICVEPVPGPYGDRMLPERTRVAQKWGITKKALEEGKVEDIIRFFNWYYTQEGSRLYSYGIEGISYDMVDGKPILNKQLVLNGFDDFRAVGMNYEPFGLNWAKDSYMQCLFAGKSIENLTDIQTQTYNGLFVINNDYYYSYPRTIETEEYVKYHTSLICEGVCKLRDKAIRGEISVKEFETGYKALKEKGLNKVIQSGTDYYRLMMNGGN